MEIIILILLLSCIIIYLYKKLHVTDRKNKKDLKGVDYLNKATQDLEDFYKEKGYDIKLNRFKKRDFWGAKEKNKDGSLDKRFKENRN